MIVEMLAETDLGEAVWIEAYLDDNKIALGWEIPAYIDKELDVIVYSDELNLFVGGGSITVKSTVTLLEILKNRLG